jgi:hypothetical protein
MRAFTSTPFAVGAVPTMIGSADARNLAAGGSGAGARWQAAHARATPARAKSPTPRRLALVLALPVDARFICPLQRDSAPLATLAKTTGEENCVISD